MKEPCSPICRSG